MDLIQTQPRGIYWTPATEIYIPIFFGYLGLDFTLYLSFIVHTNLFKSLFYKLYKVFKSLKLNGSLRTSYFGLHNNLYVWYSEWSIFGTYFFASNVGPT